MPGEGGGGVLGLIFVGYVSLVSQSLYPILVNPTSGLLSMLRSDGLSYY